MLGLRLGSGLWLGWKSGILHRFIQTRIRTGVTVSAIMPHCVYVCACVTCVLIKERVGVRVTIRIGLRFTARVRAGVTVRVRDRCNFRVYV